MSLPVIVNPLAEEDLQFGFAWCEQWSQGGDFLQCVQEIVAEIGQYPERYGKEFKNLRVAPLRRHHFAVAYRVDTTQVTVVAIYHLASNPRQWQRRR